MDRHFKCPNCGEVLDIQDAARDSNGVIREPNKNKRYRINCECGWSTGLSYDTVLYFYQEWWDSEDNNEPELHTGVVRRINLALDDVDKIPDNMADFAENCVKILEGIKRNIIENDRCTDKQEKAVRNTTRAIKKVIKNVE